MQFTQDGQEYEFNGEYRHPRTGDWYLSVCKGLVARCDLLIPLTRAIVHPVRKLHTFGGVTFRETGEFRKAKAGEFYTREDSVFTMHWDISEIEYSILEPIRIEKEES
jgi:hypothetical protein